MFAEDANYLQEADFAESDMGESPYDGYAETEYGEYPYPQPYAQPYTQPSYGIQLPQITPPGMTRTIWSQFENRYITYRWNFLLGRWIRITPRMYGGYPGMPGAAMGRRHRRRR